MCRIEATAKDAYLKAASLSFCLVSDDVDLILMVLVCCSGCIILLFCVIVVGTTKTVVFEHICNSP